ncbi:hypothetical protein KBC99_02410 [Candidatus Saccharibacteria bacterium]|nr:hypothetical protein [Candidatus Saccharibacteria bacterium]
MYLSERKPKYLGVAQTPHSVEGHADIYFCRTNRGRVEVVRYPSERRFDDSTQVVRSFTDKRSREIAQRNPGELIARTLKVKIEKVHRYLPVAVSAGSRSHETLF